MDRNRLDGSVNLLGHGDRIFGVEEGTRLLAGRSPRPDLSADPDLPDDTRLWAALQQAGGSTWGGCVYDVKAIAEALKRRYLETPDLFSPRRDLCFGSLSPSGGEGRVRGRKFLIQGHPAVTVDATFWLPRKKLSGSYFAFTATSRSKFAP